MSTRWSPPTEISKEEAAMLKRLKTTGKLFGFLRRSRLELFDDDFQAELMAMYSDTPRGVRPKPAAQLAMATLLQAYEGASDAAAVQNAVFDKRWQMVLGCLDESVPPFSQGALVDFRHRLIEHDMDKRLLERTVELARTTGDFSHKALRVALDSAPLAGGRRVEDTFNLIGHALEIVVRCAAQVVRITPKEVHEAAGLKCLDGASIKGALDIDWDNDSERADALAMLLADVKSLRSWVETAISSGTNEPPLDQALARLARILEQDLEPDPEDPERSRIRAGTAKNRQISIEDSDMKHGRKSKSRTINGFKNHIAIDLDTGLTLAVAVRPANEREHEVEPHIRPAVEDYGDVTELHIDRGYLSSNWATEMYAKGSVFSKPWVNKRATRFTKADFHYDFDNMTAVCPAGEATHIRPPKKGPAHVTFPSKTCRACAIREDCVPVEYTRGRTLSLHAQEPLLQQLRILKSTPEGRKKLRLRITVEHRLAHHVRRQGHRARYVGLRKNTFDSRRVAAVENLHCALRFEQAA